MSKPQAPVVANHETEAASSYASYIVGFVLSVLLTFSSYFIVTRHILSGQAALIAIGGLAALQFIVQLLCFLHLGGEAKPRWKMLVFWFMILVVFIVVVGSIWIMHNLNYHMMPESELKTYLHTNEGI